MPLLGLFPPLFFPLQLDTDALEQMTQRLRLENEHLREDAAKIQDTARQLQLEVAREAAGSGASSPVPTLTAAGSDGDGDDGDGDGDSDADTDGNDRTERIEAVIASFRVELEGINAQVMGAGDMSERVERLELDRLRNAVERQELENITQARIAAANDEVRWRAASVLWLCYGYDVSA